MRHLYERKIRQSPSLSFGDSKNDKLVGYDSGGRNRCCFELDGVVDTPRRTCPSISKRCDHVIASFFEFRKTISLRTVHFAPENNLYPRIFFQQEPTNMLQKLIGVGLAIVEKSNLTAG